MSHRPFWIRLGAADSGLYHVGTPLLILLKKIYIYIYLVYVMVGKLVELTRNLDRSPYFGQGSSDIPERPTIYKKGVVNNFFSFFNK